MKIILKVFSHCITDPTCDGLIEVVKVLWMETCFMLIPLRWNRCAECLSSRSPAANEMVFTLLTSHIGNVCHLAHSTGEQQGDQWHAVLRRLEN